jgi:hypothetical protein
VVMPDAAACHPRAQREKPVHPLRLGIERSPGWTAAIVQVFLRKELCYAL